MVYPAKTLLRVLAVVCGVAIFAIIAHKAHADISALAQKHSGGEFWQALARYFLGNLAGGSGRS